MDESDAGLDINLLKPKEIKEFLDDYTDYVYSAPMMSSIAYQCVLLRVSEDQDIETAKKLLEENADPASGYVLKQRVLLWKTLAT